MIGMKTKSALIGAGLLFTAAPAFSAVIDGINVPDSPGDHSFAGTFEESSVAGVGDVLSGSGQIAAFDNNLDFCATAGCALNFSFDGYTVQSIDESTGSANFSGGTVTFTTGDGDTFLTTSGANVTDTDSTLVGSNIGSSTQASGFGRLNVTGGDAADIFDTNSLEDGVDLYFNSSFSPGGPMAFTGSADLHYNSGGNPTPPPSPVPEPSELAVLGFGVALVGLGLGFRRRRFDV